MRAPSFHSDPHVQFLSQLLEEVSVGHLQVPRFQRPLVWKWEQRRELLRSIRDGIPIGSIMVWRTARVAIDCYEYLGPHRLSSPPDGTTHQYLLDGVQRLSTLYGALRPVSSDKTITENDEDLQADALGELNDESAKVENFQVFFDTLTRDFFNGVDDDVTPSMIPLHLVFDSIALLQFQRKFVGDGLEEAVKVSDEIARAFRDYKIPIIPITTDDVDMATRTFQRINSQGTHMSEAHMVHALTWSDSFNLNQKITEVRNGILAGLGWAGLDGDPILKACKAAFGLDVYKTNAQELSDVLKSRPDVVMEVGEALGRAAKFLNKVCRVPTPELVPYSLQIVLLTEAFRHCPVPDAAREEILYAWLWMTTYGELFAGMSGDQVQVALNDMREMLDSCRPVWTWRRPFEERPLNKSFDFRGARAKAFAFRLAAAQDGLKGDRKGTEILVDAGRRGLVHMLPWSREKRSMYSNPANRFLVQPAEAASLRENVVSGNLSPEQCEMHLVSLEALGYLQTGQYERFIEIRAANIAVLEREFVQPLVRKFAP
ncbi:DUF262 domain-containing protein [Paeniroseomonas aquatica]|uniref:DUF262 domain-containing protein n=3 Tax=Paeniroseomonas aquatica TaxID=373043 RepID=A0ABT7ZZD9_9PROT|nr:DUF262 domain-containing protein [Paeniroseomonas aquatica]MDN3562835.1 DUF262 domain-containing protein [Paeniroseomonas aquatica]